jgi:hypothetical protein
VTVGRQTYKAAIIKQVVLTIDQIQFMPQVEVGPIIAVPGCDVGVQPRFPFPFLHHHDRIGDQRIAAHMV